MKRLLNICLLLTSFIGYLEWGGGNHAFLGHVEYDVLFRTQHHSETFMHPFIAVPLCGQIMLLISVFKKTPRRTLTLAGLGCLSIIMLFLLLIGVFSANVKIVLSAVPFIITGIFVLRYNRKEKGIVNEG